MIQYLPLLGPFLLNVYRRLTVRQTSAQLFRDSASYWEQRYRDGRDSGTGSYGKFAVFKAQLINQFVVDHGITSVIEFGCGDGNQLALASYPRYLGFDVSEAALELCCGRFPADPTKTFGHVDDYNGETADLVLSLDVIYHLVEDLVFETYMRRLFRASTKYVIIYSSNEAGQPLPGGYIRHRRFTDWTVSYAAEWRFVQHIPNKYPFKGDHRQGSFAEFFIYEKISR